MVDAVAAVGKGLIQTADGADFNAAAYGLTIDETSQYEDCAYMRADADETAETRAGIIDKHIQNFCTVHAEGTSRFIPT